MAGQNKIEVIGPSYSLGDRKSAVQRSVNLYMLQIEGLGEAKRVVLASAPGLALLADMGAEFRGSYNTDARWFVVYGSKLYEMATDGTSTVRGSLASNSGFVGMKSGRDQLVIVDGDNGYVFSLTTNTLAQITDPDFRGSHWVDEMDGYFIFCPKNSDQFYLSAIDNGARYDALDFSSADAAPDNIIAHRVRRRELHLFGTRSIEIWIDSGDADFPFVRYNSTPIDVGIVGPRAVCVAADAMVWVGQTDRGRGYVYLMAGHQPQRISTQAVEEAIDDSTDMSQCVLWTYHVTGNEFVGVNAPGMQTTWVYDFSVGQWHERAEWVNGAWQPLRVEAITYVNGQHFAMAGTKVYRMGLDIFSLNGAALLRERTWPHLVSPALEPISYRGLELACTTGGDIAGSITLEVSNDGGFTFPIGPLRRSLGSIGRWMHRVRWLFLGTSRDRVFRLRCSDPVPLTIHQGTVDA